MEAILEYIMEYYTWFLSGAIIILLAIIGYYADKTNFGQGKQKQDINKDDKLNLNKIDGNQTLGETINNVYNNQTQDDVVEEQESVISTMNEEVNEKNSSKVQQESIINIEEQTSNQESKSNIEQEFETNFETEFEKFDKEFDEILPKKEIINDELLEEIDGLSLEKTQKLDLNNIPDLDDVDLPRIKTFEPEEQDVWKF